QVENLYLKSLLKEHRGRINNAARAAGIHSRSLFNKMKRLGIKKEDYR
ncbi:MAG: sigma-54-dependent Fis family transcriptional regulator, partial [Proteobacteria bacterium]|nr:sigma-54-dependent Fis family transcriptional regulator [Pseudomonadota bacterium]